MKRDEFEAQKVLAIDLRVVTLGKDAKMTHLKYIAQNCDKKRKCVENDTKIYYQ